MTRSPESEQVVYQNFSEEICCDDQSIQIIAVADFVNFSYFLRQFIATSTRHKFNDLIKLFAKASFGESSAEFPNISDKQFGINLCLLLTDPGLPALPAEQAEQVANVDIRNAEAGGDNQLL